MNNKVDSINDVERVKDIDHLRASSVITTQLLFSSLSEKAHKIAEDLHFSAVYFVR